MAEVEKRGRGRPRKAKRQEYVTFRLQKELYEMLINWIMKCNMVSSGNRQIASIQDAMKLIIMFLAKNEPTLCNPVNCPHKKGDGNGL